MMPWTCTALPRVEFQPIPRSDAESSQEGGLQPNASPLPTAIHLDHHEGSRFRPCFPRMKGR